MMNTKRILSTLAAAVDLSAVQKLVAGDRESGDLFGISVSLSADSSTALIGTIYDDSATGSAYVFTCAANGTWSQQAKLTAADGAYYFGCSVSLSADGGTALIGETYYDLEQGASGAAYVFIRAADGTWSQQAKLTAVDGKREHLFGNSVSLSGDGGTALIGASYHDNKGERSGAAYVFTRATDGAWMQQTRLTAADGEAGDFFGSEVFLSSDSAVALIGASGDDNMKGSAYIFTRAADGTYTQQAKLTAADGVAKDYFSNTLSLSSDGGVALIGAAGDDDSGSTSGSAYVFRRAADGTWSQQAKLTAADGAANDQFASSASLSADGDIALIGAMGDDELTGSAYIFTCSADGTWSQQQKLVVADSTDGGFGKSVSLSPDGGKALIGAAWKDGQKGAAYVFTSSV